MITKTTNEPKRKKCGDILFIFEIQFGNRVIGPIQTVASNLTRLRLSITRKSQNRAVFFGKNESSSSKKHTTHSIIVCMYTCTHTRGITPHTAHTLTHSVFPYMETEIHSHSQLTETEAEGERHVFIYTLTHLIKHFSVHRRNRYILHRRKKSNELSHPNERKKKKKKKNTNDKDDGDQRKN